MIIAGVQLDERRLIARAMCNLRPANAPKIRWAMVRDTFGVGSTVAYAMCREFKLDPEETVKPQEGRQA
ncbi:hypothetical protein [Pseudomonas gingeri]|uniref:hypothetical protein n=1 Tax=Pseudomonas gingeri TaxID=117681 RepID=UPI0015A1842D|nr:hypothetical protein [Pseudomonas gingeri]NWA11921.1 hypothetical protein [Pseudomonas gingeri]